MSTNIYKPYTYLIGWSSHNKYYYGVQYGKDAHPTNLFNTYFTSSKYVTETIENLGEPDVIQVRKTFETSQAARYHEKRVIDLLKLVHRNDFLNRSNGSTSFFNNGGYKCPNRHVKAISEYQNTLLHEGTHPFQNTDNRLKSLLPETRAKASQTLKETVSKREGYVSPKKGGNREDLDTETRLSISRKLKQLWNEEARQERGLAVSNFRKQGWNRASCLKCQRNLTIQNFTRHTNKCYS